MSAMEIAEGSMSLMAEENKSEEIMAQVSVLQQLVDRISSPPISELLGKLKLDEGLKTDLQSLDAILDDVESMAYRVKQARLWLDELKEVGYDLEDLLDKIATEILSHQLESKPWNIETCLENIRDQLENISSGITLLLQRGKYNFGSSEASWILKTSSLDPKGSFGVQSRIYGEREEEKYGRREGIRFFRSSEASWKLKGSLRFLKRNLEAKSRIYGGREEKKFGRREDKELFGLREASRILRKPHPLSAAKFHLEDESQVDGRDEDKNAIIELLLSDNQTDDPVTVIPIVGVDGVGKTTLARLVYNDYRVSEQFDLKGWASLSGDVPFDESLIKAFSEAFSIVDSRNIGCYMLKKILNMKKFLLVLDDVPSDWPLWEMIHTDLSEGAKGSKILLTSNRFPSSYKRPKWILRNYDLKPLISRVSWMLFVKHAFADKEIGLHPGLEAIGKNIVTKCGGLPLLIVTLGAMLRFKPSVEERKAVLRKVSDSVVQNDIGSILWMSYNSLPPNLKRCFAYCSMFSVDHEYDKEKLVLLWMAEGFLQHSKHRRIEEVGHEYFDELTSRSFFQKSGANSSRFVMHSLMHKLAQFASGFFCFSFVNSMNESGLPSEVVRHLSLSVKSYKKLISCNTSHLRTLFLYYLSPGESSTLFLYCLSPGESSIDLGTSILARAKNCQCLRVLSFSDDTITELPDSIGALKLLQYLDLSHTKITRLPDFVTTLYNLQTLLLSYCRSLAELPTTLMKLAYLRHLDIKETCLKEMPAEMGCLTNLQSLSDFVVGELSGSNIRELGPLKSLGGTLRISRLQNVVSDTDAAEADLKSKAYLKVLELKWSDATANSQHATNVLEKLEPHRNLEKLSIISYNGMCFPDWVGDSSFSKVVFLHLSDCNSCSHLPPLGQLPSLKELIIEGMRGVKKIGPEFFGVNNASANPFPSLEILVFREMPEWEGWIPSEMQPVEFPCLKRVHIESCPKYEDHCFSPSVEVEISVSEDTSKELHLPDSNVVQPSEQSSTSNSPPSEFPQHLTEDSSAKHGGASDNFAAATETSTDADNREDGQEDISGPEQESWNPRGASNNSLAAIEISSDTDYATDTDTDVPINDEGNKAQFRRNEKLLDVPLTSRLPEELHLPDSNVVQPSEQSSTSKSPPSESPRHLEWEGWIPSEMQPLEFPCLKRKHIESCPKYEDHCCPPSVEVEISVSEDTSKELHLPDSNVVQPSEQSSTSKSPPSESPQHLTEDSSAKRGGASDIFDAATKTSSGADNSEDGREGISGPEQESWNPPGASNDSSAASDTDYSEDSQEDISSPEQESINVSQFEELKRLKQMPCSLEIEACDAQFLPADLNKYNNLQHLYFINCHLLKSIQANQLPEALKSLYIRKCKEVKFPFTAERHNSLENLCIESSCDSLVSFPLAIFPQLRSLSIWDCANFNSLLITEDHKFLDALEIRNCAQFISFPEEKLHIPSLTSILLSKCKNLKGLPGQLHGLKSLQSLLIDKCPEAESVPKGGLPSSLNLVSISFCRKLTPCIEWGLHELNDLSRIEIEDGSEDLESFPEQNLLPRNLISLRISSLPNLEVLDYKGLQHLTCLETLKLNRCNKLRSLPDEGLPSSLSYLYISDCPLLNSELQNRRGKEWIKIAQIPHIQIDGKVIS